MVYRKQKWMKYGRNGKRCKIEIEDEDGRRLDRMNWNISDKVSEAKIFGVLKYNYGIFSKAPKKEQI